MHPTWCRISSNCSLSVCFASLDARISLNFIHSLVVFFSFQPCGSLLALVVQNPKNPPSDSGGAVFSPQTWLVV